MVGIWLVGVAMSIWCLISIVRRGGARVVAIAGARVVAETPNRKERVRFDYFLI
jgi:hypothetical protein